METSLIVHKLRFDYPIGVYNDDFVKPTTLGRDSIQKSTYSVIIELQTTERTIFSCQTSNVVSIVLTTHYLYIIDSQVVQDKIDISILECLGECEDEGSASLYIYWRVDEANFISCVENEDGELRDEIFAEIRRVYFDLTLANLPVFGVLDD